MALVQLTPNRQNQPQLLQYATMGPTTFARYNSFQSTLNRRFSRNAQLQVAYTFSRCMTNGSYLGSFNNNVGSVATNPYNQNADWGPCGWDVKHVLNVNGMYVLPFHGNRIVEGWQISGILRSSTGLPFSAFAGVDFSGFGNTTLRPDSLTGNVNPISGTTASGETLGTPTRWFDPTQFGPPAIGTVGNLGAGTLRGAHFNVTDIALTKDTKITENVRVQFRAEFFNLFNHTNYALPVGLSGAGGIFTGLTTATSVNGVATVPVPGSTTARAIRNTQAGRINGYIGTPRQIQFGLKFIF